MRRFNLLLIVIAFTIFSCQKEDKIEESVKYTLTVENKTLEDVDLFLNGHLDNSGFVSEGTVLAGKSKKISNLVVSVNYTLRASLAGEAHEDHFDEQNFVNKDASKFDMTIDITQ